MSSINRITLIGLASLALAMGIGRFAYTPLLPMMNDDGLVDIADGGLLASVHFLGYLLGAIFAVKFPLPPKRTLQLSLLCIGVGTALMGLTNEFTIWLVIRWVHGVCSAWVLMLISNYYIKYLTDNRREECQGWVFSGVGAGIFFAGMCCLLFMGKQISSSVGWQILGAISLITVFVISVNLGPEIPDVQLATKSNTSHRGPLNWRIAIAYAAMGLGYIIPATYLPIMAREIIQSPLIFGLSWPIFGIAAFVSTVLVTKLQARYSNRQIWAASQLIMALGLLLPVINQQILTIIAAGLLVGSTFMIITMVGMKEAHAGAPPQDVMRHIAVMTASFAMGQMLGPLFAGYIYDVTHSFALPLIITSTILIATAITLVRVDRLALPR